MNYLILAELILSYYYIKSLILTGSENSYLLLLIFVIYLVTKMLVYIDFSKLINKIIISISFAVLILDYYVGSGLMIIFFPVTLCQMNNMLLGNKKLFYLFLATPLLIIQKELIDIYLIIAGLSFALELSTRRTNEKIAKQQDTIFAYKQHQQKLEQKLTNAEQRMESTIFQVKLEERNEISQRLHDEIGHNLAGNIMKLEAIKKVMQVDINKSIDMLTSVTDNLRHGMNSIREILKKVKPERSSINIANIKDIVNKINKESNCKISLKYNSDINTLNQNMWNTITSNIREILTNMIKYSEATECVIEFTKLNKIYKVNIRDNGVGCKNISKGLGLRGIEDRMAMQNGYAIFDGSEGFRVTMIFNINISE